MTNIDTTTEIEPVWEDMGYGAMPPDPEDAPKVRAREPRHKHPPTWIAPNVVTVAKCLAHVAGCRSQVDVTAEGMHALESFTRQLAKRDEQPLDLNACFLCDGCRIERHRASEGKSEARRARVTESVRYLKAAEANVIEEANELVSASRTAPDRTRDAVVAAMERLAFLGKVLGGGYVSDLVVALRNSRRTGKAKPRRDDL